MINLGTNIASEMPLRISTNLPNQTNDFESRANPRKETQDKDAAVAQSFSVIQNDKDDVVSAVDMVNQMLMVKSTNLVFEFHDKTEPPVVKVVDKENGDVIREIPSKELREIAKALNDIADSMTSNSGFLLNERL